MPMTGPDREQAFRRRQLDLIARLRAEVARLLERVAPTDAGPDAAADGGTDRSRDSGAPS
jgi:hypothetical protein